MSKKRGSATNQKGQIMSDDGGGGSSADNGQQQLARLLRLYRAREGDDADSSSSSNSKNKSSTSTSNANDATTKGFEIVASIGVERMKVLLADRLAAQMVVGQSQYQDHEFLDAFQAVFWGLHAPSNAHEGEQWRKKMFAMIIQSMHAQNAPNALAAAILNVLMRELHHLNVVDLPTIIEELVRGVLLCQQLQRLRPSEGLVIFYSIELLPQLLLRVAQCPLLEFNDSVMSDQCSGSEYKDKVLAKFFALAWPKRFFLQVLKTFRDFNFNDEQERELCGKIFREANREIPDEIASDSHVERNDCFESLPTIFYNVMLLIGRTKNEFCKRLLMNMLLRKCDAIASGSAILYADQRAAGGSSSSLSGRFTNAGREIKVLLSTMIYHVDLVLKHDESIAKVFMAEYELRVKDLTSFDIGLLLTIATQEKYEARVNNFLIQRVVQSYKPEALEYGAASESSGVFTRSAFLDTITNPQDGSWSPVTQRMVHFGFLLLAHGASKQDESSLAASIQSKQQQQQSLGDRMELPWLDFAIRIILGCFQHHMSAREKIVDQLVNSIIVQDGGSKTAIKLLARIIKRHPLDINHKLAERLQECLEYVTHMTPQNARLLFSALSPLLKVRPNIKSFLILTLRKAMFRKDEKSRMIAIIGFSFLLCLSSTIFSRSSTLTQLYSQNTNILLSQGVQGGGGSTDNEIATQEHANAVVAEDLYRQFCGIFKRAFQLQTRVRLVLYAELDKVFHECPTLRPSILDLAFQHYSKYYDENESILPPLKVDSCLARKRGFYEEPLGYLVHVLLICVLEIKKDSMGENDMDDMLGDDDIPATQTAGAQKSFEAVERNVSILMERMKRCELVDFEINKNLSFAPQTAMGQSNQRLAKILLDVWEVCMNWTIVANSGAIKMDEATWSALIHYLEMHKWLKARLRESEDKSKSVDVTERKRGRPSNKQKLQKQQQSGNSGASVAATISEQVSTQQSSKNDDFASFFGEHASFTSGLLLSPSSILSLLDFSVKKLQGDLSAISRDDEHLLLFMLDKAALLVEFAQQSVGSSSSNLFNQKSMLMGESRVLIDRLGSIVFGIFYLCHEMGSAASSTSLSGNKSQASQIEDIRCEALRVFAAIVHVWMMKSTEEAADCLAYALSSVGFQDEDELMGDGNTSKLENCATVLHKLFDTMTLKSTAREAIVVLGIVKSVWCKLPARVIAKYESWMKHALLRSNFASQKLLETMVHMFLRPHPEIGLLLSFALQLTKGLLHYCNGGDDNSEVTEFANAPDRLSLDRFDEKCILTCAVAVLARCEEATSELEPIVKDFDAQQRRQTMKLKEDDVNLLQLLEDETGSSVLDLANTTSKSHAKYKGICRKLFELCGILLPFVMMDLNKTAVSIRVIRLIGRLYKLLVVMVNCKLRRKDSTLPKYLQRLFDRVASELTPMLLQFIACIHDEGKKTAIASASKARTKQSTTSTTTAQSKLIPEVIFQMEQFDVALIKLSKLSKDRIFDQWIRLRQSRDFRFNREKIKERIDEDGDEKGLTCGDTVNESDASAAEEEEEREEANEQQQEQEPEVTVLTDNVETESTEDEGDEDTHDERTEDDEEVIAAAAARGSRPNKTKRRRRNNLEDEEE